MDALPGAMNSKAGHRKGHAGRWKRFTLAAALVVASGQSGAGHSVGHFPSYYPDEIRIDAMAPDAAAKGLADATVHAYVGAAPKLSGAVPPHVKSVKSLGSFLVLSFDARSARFQSAEARCAAASGLLARLRGGNGAGFTFHPYPVTPYHADYLHHLDRAEAAATGVGSQPTAAPPVGAKGGLAETIVRDRLGAVAEAADVVLEAVPLDDLISAAGVQFSGWMGPPWLKEGWFHAYRLLAPGLDAKDRPLAEEAYERLTRGELRGGLAERADLERSLVATLGRGCTRVAVGYALREEYFSEAYPPGVENVAFDAVGGLNAPIFIRTAKLKEYPWNGKLNLGVPRASDSAWNPVGGFTDATARLMWAAIGDPAMIPFPFNASWMPNRVQSELAKVEGQSGGFEVPADALRPQPGSGLLERVGDWAFASEKVTYEVLLSPFDDGTEQGVADLLYPYAFTYRWGDKANLGANAYEPRIGAMLAAIRERLVGLKVVRVDETKHAIAEGMELVVKTPVVEVYLNAAPGDERQVANLAPPWSTVPWHLLALMEAAVVRGYAAFSAEEATTARGSVARSGAGPRTDRKVAGAGRAIRAGKLSPGAAAGSGNRRGGAGALAGAQGLCREERPFPDRQRPLPAEGLDAGHDRAGGRARDDLPAGLRHLRPFRPSAERRDRLGSAGRAQCQSARQRRDDTEGRARLHSCQRAAAAHNGARALSASRRLAVSADRCRGQGSQGRQDAMGRGRALCGRPGAGAAAGRL